MRAYNSKTKKQEDFVSESAYFTIGGVKFYCYRRSDDNRDKPDLYVMYSANGQGAMVLMKEGED